MMTEQELIKRCQRAEAFVEALLDAIEEVLPHEPQIEGKLAMVLGSAWRFDARAIADAATMGDDDCSADEG